MLGSISCPKKKRNSLLLQRCRIKVSHMSGEEKNASILSMKAITRQPSWSRDCRGMLPPCMARSGENTGWREPVGLHVGGRSRRPASSGARTQRETDALGQHVQLSTGAARPSGGPGPSGWVGDAERGCKLMGRWVQPFRRSGRWCRRRTSTWGGSSNHVRAQTTIEREMAMGMAL
jgi:hypothetical protein